MQVLVSAFPADSKSGGGWVTSRIMKYRHFPLVVSRPEPFLVKGFYTVMGICLFPFLHPIFTRYTPIAWRWRSKEDEAWLNFSQTFALSLMFKGCVLVCHDLQCHRPYRMTSWLRWSEGFLLRRATKVVVLSGRDAKIVNRYYRVPSSRIENLGSHLMSDLRAFRKEVIGAPKSVAFLGSLDRKENREGLSWFTRNVLPACPDLEVMVIGHTSDPNKLHHPQLRYLGFVEDLKAVMSQQDFMIAPLFSQAGIKIKVIEALLAGIPVLGTTAAYGGLKAPGKGWSSDNAENWIAILKNGGCYEFGGLC